MWWSVSGRHPLEGSSDPMPAQEGSASCSQHSAGCCCEPDLSAGVPEPSCMPEAGGTAQEAAQGRPGRRRDRTCTERGGRLHAIALLLCLTLADRPCLGGTGPVLNDLMRNSPLLRGGGASSAGGGGLTGGHDAAGAGAALDLDLDLEAAAAACQSASGRGEEAPCKYFILDVSEIAQELGLPTCTEARLVSDPETGMMLPDPKFVAPNATIPEAAAGTEWIYPYTSSPHYHSQNAGPWYVYQTLRNSRHTVATIDEADVIYVYDYCYMMWILSDHHARQHWWLRDNYQPELKTGSYLLSSYRAIMALPRWQETGGRDFVFYHSHSGYEWDDVDTTNKYQEMLCHDFQWATMLVIEQMQRWRCHSYNPRTTVVAPYSSTEVIAALPDATKTQFLFFRGDCEPPVPDNVGKYMRKLVIGSIRAAAERGANASAAAAAGPAGGNAPGLFPGGSDDSAAGGEEDIYGENEKDELNICCHGRAAAPEVACTEREFPLNELKVQPHRPMLESMAASLFCLILPGNSQSSQRITEAFLTGCVPVFLGPPWHTLPFSHEVDYAAASIFLNISSDGGRGSAPWWTRDDLQVAPGIEADVPVEDRFSPAWWFADVPQEAIAPLHDLNNVLPFLQQLSEEDISAKQGAVHRYRSMFIYGTQPQHPPSASDIALEMMCTFTKYGVRD